MWAGPRYALTGLRGVRLCTWKREGPALEAIPRRGLLLDLPALWTIVATPKLSNRSNRSAKCGEVPDVVVKCLTVLRHLIIVIFDIRNRLDIGK